MEAMNEKIELFMTFFFITVMIVFPVLFNYKRYILSKSKVLFTLKHHMNWRIYTTIFSLLTGAGALFFAFVGFITIVRSHEIGIWGWLLIFAAVVFFGTLAFILNPINAKTKFTEKGIMSCNQNFFWHQIKGYEWEQTLISDKYYLRIVAKIIWFNMPCIIRGLVADAAEMKIITRIIENKVTKES